MILQRCLPFVGPDLKPWHVQALAVVNATAARWKKLWFYPFKNEFLSRYGTFAGNDLQVIEHACWNCDDGLWRGREMCWRCSGTGIYHRAAVVLDRYEIGGLIFHRPKARLIAPRDHDEYAEWISKRKSDYHSVITGLITHECPPRIAAELTYLLLLFIFSRALFGPFLNHVSRQWMHQLQPQWWIRARWRAMAWYRMNRMPDGYGSPEYWPDWLHNQTNHRGEVPF